MIVLSAGPLENGHKEVFGYAAYDWAKRIVNCFTVSGRREIMLNISRSPDSQRGLGSASIAIFFGDERDTDEPGAQLTERELREMLVAIGCEWAKEK